MEQLLKKEAEEEKKRKRREEKKELVENRKKEAEKRKREAEEKRKQRKKTQKESRNRDSEDNESLPIIQKPKRKTRKPKRYLNDEEPVAAVGEEVEVDTTLCSFCTSHEAPSTSTSDREFDGWFNCNVCDSWFHCVCQGFTNEETLPTPVLFAKTVPAGRNSAAFFFTPYLSENALILSAHAVDTH
ncbi:uncharacterized protein LOC134265567 [Saccostrea cucullata]|uniref:uncharacterized protein LOC134265567 n=1 Tax=Saccostrea cuccullata TaxID=36930 RepID=UPI002ED1E015